MPDLVLCVRAAAEFLEVDVLAGDGLDDVRAGDEHVRGLVDHHHEVGQRGGVDVAARVRAHDQRDLRDHAGRADVAAEDLAVEAERDDTLLDARAAALVDADDRPAGLDRQVHDLDDLLAVHLAERAAEDRDVLAEHAHRTAVDGAVAGHHAVAVRAVLLQAEVGGAVPGQLVQFDERAGVEQQRRCARGRSSCPWRAASRPRAPSRRAPPRRCAGRGRRACRRWCGRRASSVGTCPIGSVALLMGSQPNESIAERRRAVVQATATCWSISGGTYALPFQ